MTHDEEIKSIKHESVMDKIKKDAEKVARPHCANCTYSKFTGGNTRCICGRDEEVLKVVSALYVWYRTGYRHGEADTRAEIPNV